ncbi:MAG: hypothetical protein JOZ27_09005 [Caulobacteraceae bacterium]|nr:hypothetical protein [Caulobacteraceae bacterium]
MTRAIGLFGKVKVAENVVTAVFDADHGVAARFPNAEADIRSIARPTLENNDQRKRKTNR